MTAGVGQPGGEPGDRQSRIRPGSSEARDRKSRGSGDPCALARYRIENRRAEHRPLLFPVAPQLARDALLPDFGNPLPAMKFSALALPAGA